jgi:hypothetical protein
MMVSSTLKQYTDNYNKNLLNYLQEYEDNTKAFFLQNEKVKYQNYQNALSKISNQLQLFTREELNNNQVHKSIATDLKNISTEVYNKIITELNQTPNDGILSLSNLKNDKISINEKELENHLKSSIVILKFISEEYEEAIQTKTTITKDESGEVALIDSTEYQIDPRLDLWMKKYEKENDYIHIPLAIEGKKDWVTDKYKNFEERYYKSQLEICNAILNVVPKENEIIAIKTEFKTKLIDLRNKFPLPDTDINKLISEINNAFYRLEKFMKGSSLNYSAFYFNDAFTLLFNELNKLENISINNDNLIHGYYGVINQICHDYDKSDFDNSEAYENEDFNRDCNEIMYLAWDRLQEFITGEEEINVKISIRDIANNNFNVNGENGVITSTTTDVTTENLYPRIFTTVKAFEKFKNLVNEFGNTKENLANYSFVFHRMKRDGLIYDDFQKLQFTYFLLKLDINIDRIKPMKEIGKLEYRESIYNRV